MPVEKLRKRREVQLRQLAGIGPFVEGSIVRLPHPSCDHVAHRLTFKVRGKTKAVYVPVDLVEEVEQWHRNYKRLKKLVRQITKTSLAILHRYVPEQRGVRSREKSPEANLAGQLSRLVRHFFPDFNAWLDDLPEHRNPDLLYYSRRHLVWAGLLMFLLHLRSRLQFNLDRQCATLVANLDQLAQTSEETIAHGDTLAGWFRRVPAANVLDLVRRCVRRLIRMKALDDFRLEGRFLVAIDGTGMLTFDRRHCPHCLTRQLSDGGTLYYHPVLEAKLVAPVGLALSVATDFIENPADQTPDDKQDCEKKAFYRLAEQLHAAFPRTPFCLLLDALYLDGGIIACCVRYGWTFLITFKSGSMPAVWAEAQRLVLLQSANRLVTTLPNGTRRIYRWAIEVDAGGLNALFCEETNPAGLVTTFAWLTNFTITRQNAIALADQGGRLRWKIENEGFNTQKNGGFALEHAYCRDGNAARVFYGLLQLAHLLQQILTLGSLLRPFQKRFVTVRNFVRRLTESLRHELLPPLADLPPIGQFRWDSS